MPIWCATSAKAITSTAPRSASTAPSAWRRDRCPIGDRHPLRYADGSRLRRDGDVLFERVATFGDAIVGHILFSRLPIIGSDGRIIAAASLAPLCVRPDCQKQGIGAGLVGAGLEECRKRHLAAIIVVGDPDYYRRFGFSAAAAGPLAAPFAGPHFMAIELQPDALKDGGEVRYLVAFDLPN